MGKFTGKTTKEALELYAQGLSTRELAKRYEVSRTAIKYLLRRNGIEPRKPRKKVSTDPPEKVERDVVRLRLEGVRFKAIATKVGITDARVSEILIKHNLHTRLKRGENSTHRRKIKPEQEADLAAAYEAGASIEDLAKQYGCTYKPMKDALKRAGVTFRPRGGAAKAWTAQPGFKEKVVELWEGGLSQTKISAELGCSQSVVSKTLKGFGIEAKNRIKERHGMWKGGKIVTPYGYVSEMMEHDHPFAQVMRTQNGYVLQHRLVMAEELGRPLQPYETVHHINGDRKDNRIENLQLRTGNHGSHVRYQCLDCGSSNVEPAEL